MPCHDGYGEQEMRATIARAQGAYQIFDTQGEYERTVLYNSIATPLLCEAMDIIERNGLLLDCSPMLQAWVRYHNMNDLIRLRDQMREAEESGTFTEWFYELSDRDRKLMNYPPRPSAE